MSFKQQGQQNKNKKGTVIAIISSIIFAIIAGFFLSRVGVPIGFERLNPVMMIAIVCLSYIPFVRYRGRRGGYVLFMLGLTAVIIEYIAIKTCFPYGCFVYTDQLGYQILDTVPWTVLFGWTPLVLMIDAGFTYFSGEKNINEKKITNTNNSYFLFGKKISKYLLWFFGGLVLMLCDIILDPGAVNAGFWIFEGEHRRYNVPRVNFLGWILSGFIGLRELDLRKTYLNKTRNTKHITHTYQQTEKKQLGLRSRSGIVMMLFWSSYAVWEGLWGVVGVCGVVGLIGVYIYRNHIFTSPSIKR